MRRKCELCGKFRSFREFLPAAWAGSPDCPTPWDQSCQEQLRTYWAGRLAQFFAVKPMSALP